MVCKIPCKNCERVYVGETGRPLRARVKEHRKEVDSITGIFTRAEKTTTASICSKVVLEKITVIEFGVSNRGGNGASCGGSKVRTDATKLSYMVIAIFRQKMKRSVMTISQTLATICRSRCTCMHVYFSDINSVGA